MKTAQMAVSKEELAELLATIMPFESIDSVLVEYDRLQAMGINNAARWGVFLANCVHESASFTRMEENLYYSESRIRQVWPSRIKTRSTAKRLAGNPRALANFVYNGRMGNRPGSDDGWKYRGRGPFMHTGANNYISCGNRIGVDLREDPDLLSEVLRFGILAAADYFVNRRFRGETLLGLSDRGDHKKICRLINGGYHGLLERTSLSRLYTAWFTKDEGLFKRPLVRRGTRDKHVKVVQYYLRKLGYRIYKIDGVFGRGTEAQVKAFQKNNGLKADGCVGGYTFNLLSKQ